MHRQLIAIVVACFSASSVLLAAEPPPSPDLKDLARTVEELAARAEEAKALEDAAASGDAVADAALRHLVRVKIWTRRDDGEWPPVGGTRYDLNNERPTLWSGVIWDETHVLMRDPVLHERFIRRIEIEADGETREARVSGWLQDTAGLLLEIDTPLPGRTPLTFAGAPERKELGALRSVSYGHERDGGWCLTVGGAFKGTVRSEKGESLLDVAQMGVLVRPDGKPVGLALTPRVSLEPGERLWRGTELREATILSAEAMAGQHETIKALLRQAAPGVRFEFRSQVEENNQMRFIRRWDDSGMNDNEQAEAYATGFLLSDGRLLVPIDLPRDTIARLRTISVLLPDGEPREAEFVGALRNWKAVLLKVKGAPLSGGLQLTTAEGFSPGRLFLKAHIDYSLRRRKERFTYDRYQGLFRTYDDEPGVWTFTNESDGSIALTPEGRVLAISLAQRTRPAGERERYGREEESGFRPAARIAQALAAPDAIDETYRPMEEVEEKKAVALGVEWQGMGVHLAKTFNATRETRGGQIGLLVLHVYPGTAAAKAELQSEDILLRVQAPDRQEPIDLRPGYREGGVMMPDQFMDIPEEARAAFMGRMPSPWPNRRNALTNLLTEIGEGKEVRIEYLRKGEKKSFTFTTTRSEPDFESARKHRSKKLGITVKELTHEVKRFYKRGDDKAVVVSRIEMGGKASVAGLWPYQLITHVNGEAVESYDAFVKTVDALEDGQTVELTVEYMGKTRLAKMDL